MNRQSNSSAFLFLRNCLALLVLSSDPVLGQAALSDYQSTPPSPHAVTLGYGKGSELNLTLTNRGSAKADWKLLFENAGPTDLPGALEALDEKSADVLSIIPDRYLFSEGITGSSISDGGGDMYDGGNYLNAGGTTLNYSNDAMATATIGTGGVSYFTRKYDGLFVFAADFTGVNEFAITGNLGADGGGQVSVDEFTIQKGGVTYRAFVHRVQGTSDPSINHLILVPSKTGLSRSYLTSTETENDRVSGLGTSSRVYYLLFAKASGVAYPTGTFQDLADAFLDTVKGGPGWVYGNPAKGTVAAGQSGPVKLTLDSKGFEPGSYATRFAIVPDAMEYANIPSNAFQDLSLTIREPVFSIPGGNLALSTLAGIQPDPVRVNLAPSQPGVTITGLQASSSASWVIPTIGTEANSINLGFNTASLPNGSHRATIQVWNGETRREFEVSLVVSPLNVVRFLPDPTRPRIYAINGNAKEQGSILVINTLTRAIVKMIAVGKEPTDIDLTENAAELLVMNTTDRSISRIDLTTLGVTTTHQLTDFSNRNEDFGGHVVDGPGNILYYVDEQWGPRLRVYDTFTGTVLQTFGATSIGTDNDNGFGDIVVNPAKSALFGWVQYGDGAGWAGSFAVKYNIAANGTLSLADQGNSTYPTILNREPFDSQALMTANGGRLLIKDRLINQNDMDLFPLVYPDEVYSMSPNGKIVATSTGIYSGDTAEILHTLPVTTTVQTILPDYSSMVYFNTSTRALVWLDLVTTLGSKALGLEIEPGDGATVAHPDMLQWYPVTGISRYQIYLGTNRGEVETATTSSASYLGESSSTTFNLTSPLVTGQGYFWRVVPVGADGLPAGSGITRSFFVSTLTLSRSSISAETVAGTALHEETIELQSPGTQAWSVTADVPWIGFETTSGSTPGNLVLRFNASSLAAGFHQGNVTMTSGGVSFPIPVSLRVYAANFMLAESDLELPWVYVISQESNTSSQPSFLLRINTTTDVIESAIPCGRSVTDLSIHYQENRIYLTNWQTGILRAFDRDTFQQIKTYQFKPAGPVGYSDGDIWEVSAGKNGRLIVEEYDQWINMSLINTADGKSLSTGFSREGGGRFDPTGRYYYHGENNISNAELQKYDTQADTFVEVAAKRVSGFSYYGTRRVVMSGDGSRVFWNGGVFDKDLAVLLQLNNEVVSSTYRGELLFTSNAAINGVNGETLTTLPVTTSIQSVSSDQRKLYLFKAGAFTVVNISSISTVSPRGLVPGIADGATVIGTSQELSWSLESAALSYDVYFGTTASAVAAASRTSPEFLGNASGTRWTGTLPPFALGGTYFWRVDIVGFNSTKPGTTWSFKIAPIDVTPRVVELAFPSGSPIPRQSLAMSATPAVSWSASSSTPWITVRTTSGSTPGNLEFDLSSSGMSTGLKEGAITIVSGSDSFTVPVKLRIIALNITKLVPHPSRPVVYGINTSAAGEGFSHLLEIDAATAVIQRSLPIGFSPTDADIDDATDRIYVSNWGYSKTRVIDLTAWTELPALNLGEDIYRLNVASGGQIVTEGEDQWISLSLWNSATGVKTATASSTREGDGEMDPSGRYYYHCDNDISNAHITKYDLASNSFLNVAASGEYGYGSRNLIISKNGGRIFWVSRVFDSGLNLLGITPAEVYAASSGGDLAAGSNKIWWSDSGTEVSTLPFASTMAAFSANDTHLVRFNATTRTLHSTALSSITDLPGPLPRPGQVLAESPQRISWSPVPNAVSYQVFIAPNATVLAAMTTPVATVSTPYYDLPSPLAFGRFYVWRVIAMTDTGVITGKVQSFGIRFPDGPALALSGTSANGMSVAMSGQHLLVGTDGAARFYQFDTASGVTSPIQEFTTQTSSWDSDFGNTVAVDFGKAVVGDPAFDNPADNGGVSYVYRQSQLYGTWEHGGPLLPATPVLYDSFGKSIAASGNLMLISGSNSASTIGKVTAHITEPSTIRTQTFGANDGVVNDGFGSVIAMEGNQAIISSPGRGSSYSRIPSLYAFTRQTGTGLWTQTQKIAISGANSYSTTATALALSGSLMATNNGANSSVVVYTKGSNSLWSQAATISQSTIAGSSSYSFGGALALSGDQLFIGDTSATYGGKSGGAVFSFRRSGTTWVAGPVIVPSTPSYSGFGKALAVRDGWLLVAGGSTSPAFLFQVDETANHAPVFTSQVPTQVVSGRPFSYPIQAGDKDGTSGLVFDILQGPSWMSITNGSDGSAILSGTPTGATGAVHTVQLRLQDGLGGSSLYTYQLTLLAPTDLPRLTMEPAGGSYGEGQEVILRAAASGTGPFTWHWYRNGEEVPGANRSSLVVGEISHDDAGTYMVRVSNVVGSVESKPAEVVVTSANRFAGDWPTFGGSARHNGYHPARLGDHSFVSAWSTVVAAGRPLNRAALAEGKVFVTPQTYFGGSFSASALDLATGASVWNHPFEEAFSLNPPSYHNGRVYIQRGNHDSDTQLWALNAVTGAAIWNSPHAAQWENYEAPAVTDEGIWVNGGAYGGMYGFTPSGSQMFFRSMTQVDGWTPSISAGRLFTWVAGTFQEHNPTDGNSLWSLAVNNLTYSNTGVTAISGDSALVITSTDLVCIDLPSRSVRWRKSALFNGTPAIAGDHAFAIKGKTVESYALADGTPGSVVTVPEFITSGQPLLVMDHLFVSGANNTYVVRRSDSAVVQTLTGGGLLSYSGGMLVVAGTNGTLRAWRAGEIKFVTEPPDLVANDSADSVTMELQPMVVDSEGGTQHQWSIANVSNPAIFSSLTLDQNGRLIVQYAPMAWGSSTVTVKVVSESGSYTQTTLGISLPTPPSPSTGVKPGIQLNRSNGLLEQQVTVKNTAARAISGFDLTVTGLQSGVTFHNATIRKKGGGVFSYRNPIPAGASVTVTLQYYAKRRGTVPKPTIVVSLAPPSSGVASIKTIQQTRSQPPAASSASSEAVPTVATKQVQLPAAPFAISSINQGADGSISVSFPTETGANYQVQYSSDLNHWNTSAGIIKGTGTAANWVDRGPPTTESPPSSTTRRFYRVRRTIP